MQQFMRAVVAMGVAGCLSVAVSAGAQANTFTITFSGVIQDAYDDSIGQDYPGDVTIGQTFSGTLTYSGNATTHNLPHNPFTAYETVTAFDQVAWNFSIDALYSSSGTFSAPGEKITLAGFKSGPGGPVYPLAEIQGRDGGAWFNTELGWDPSVTSLTLNALSDLPADSSVPGYFFGGFNTSLALVGIYQYSGSITSYSIAENNVAAVHVANTPIPATAWLLGSALAGLGWLGWRKRQAGPGLNRAGAA